MSEDSNDENQKEPNEIRRLSAKEAAREFRKQAYRKAKERRKTDPRFLAQKERDKAFRKAAYKSAKEKNKIYNEKLKEKRKNAEKIAHEEKTKARVQEVLQTLQTASELKPKPRPHLKLVKDTGED